MTASVAAPLSTVLRDGSRAEHTAAEQSGFIADLLAGRASENRYADYLCSLERIYGALESVGRSLAGDPLAAAVLDPVLERGDAIRADLAHWGRWASPNAGATLATDAYVARIEASANWGGSYVAHHYIRYLGDLSGGQVIRRALERGYGLTEGIGTAFYDFPGIPRVKPYRDAYRLRLDALALDSDDAAKVLTEVRTIYALTDALLTELALQPT